MKRRFSNAAACAALCVVIGAVVCPAQSKKADDSTVAEGTFKGTLHVGKTDSYMVYVGEESGDFAAFCFANDSDAGRALLAACKDGDDCEFNGRVDQGVECEVDKDTQKVLSGSGKILSVKSAKLLNSATGGASHKAPAAANAAAPPNVVVSNLYAARKSERTDPFFQTRSRARLDKYFTKELADLIWKDSTTTPKGEVGALDFDPLYSAQDMKITAFKVGKPMYGEGNLKVADVPVTFKNFGKDVTVLFRLEQGADKSWKIGDILYPGAGEQASSLKKILSNP